MSEQKQHFYEFGRFRLDPLKRRLLRDAEALRLTPKAFDLLLVLVEESGRTVEKDELLERVWAGTIVEENNLNQNITTLRKLLGAVTSCRTMQPKAWGMSHSTSSALVPTLPICGKVKLMICPAKLGSVMIS